MKKVNNSNDALEEIRKGNDVWLDEREEKIINMLYDYLNSRSEFVNNCLSGKEKEYRDYELWCIKRFLDIEVKKRENLEEKEE